MLLNYLQEVTVIFLKKYKVIVIKICIFVSTSDGTHFDFQKDID